MNEEKSAFLEFERAQRSGRVYDFYSRRPSNTTIQRAAFVEGGSLETANPTKGILLLLIYDTVVTKKELVKQS